MFKVSPASLHTFIDTTLTLTPSVNPNSNYVITVSLGRVDQSVYRLATGWTFRGSNPCEGEIFRTCPDRPRVPPSLLYNGYRVFHGGKAAEA
jgi:hypothetical protein